MRDSLLPFQELQDVSKLIPLPEDDLDLSVFVEVHSLYQADKNAPGDLGDIGVLPELGQPALLFAEAVLDFTFTGNELLDYLLRLLNPAGKLLLEGQKFLPGQNAALKIFIDAQPQVAVFWMI